MKTALIVVFAATTLALGVVCVIQWQARHAQQAELTSLRSELEQKSREIADLQATQKLVDRQRREFLEQASDLAAQLQALRLAEAKAASNAPATASEVAGRKPDSARGGFGKFLSSMMQDPEARKFIRDQQRLMVDQLYGPLIRQMSFTPEEADQFKNLLADHMIKGAEKAFAMLGTSAGTNRAEAITALAADQKGFDEQLRQFLGESRYAQFKDYQETIGERTQLNQFRQQTAGSENALSEQQTEQLLAFMKKEKTAVAAATGQTPPGAGQDAANLEAMLSEGGVEKLLQAQEQVNQRVYERARGVLSENQLAAFAKFQTNQLQMMRMGMSMARKFLAPSESAAGPAQPNP